MTTPTKQDQDPTDRLSRSSEEDSTIPQDWLEEFEAAARRPLETRMRYSFIRTYKPVLDDASYRSFDTMEDYRRWCEENLPSWLGYGRV
jgi:hypothetical protein